MKALNVKVEYYNSLTGIRETIARFANLAESFCYARRVADECWHEVPDSVLTVYVSAQGGMWSFEHDAELGEKCRAERMPSVAQIADRLNTLSDALDRHAEASADVRLSALTDEQAALRVAASTLSDVVVVLQTGKPDNLLQRA